ncbi:hypothetical protein DFP73DRAFT_531368 [Morchella snyderi]|nr:hypothetical protein DFP73DRAFT_531368 [Morchella snyderi]
MSRSFHTVARRLRQAASSPDASRGPCAGHASETPAASVLGHHSAPTLARVPEPACVSELHRGVEHAAALKQRQTTAQPQPQRRQAELLPGLKVSAGQYAVVGRVEGVLAFLHAVLDAVLAGAAAAAIGGGGDGEAVDTVRVEAGGDGVERHCHTEGRAHTAVLGGDLAGLAHVGDAETYPPPITSHVFRYSFSQLHAGVTNGATKGTGKRVHCQHVRRPCSGRVGGRFAGEGEEQERHEGREDAQTTEDGEDEDVGKLAALVTGPVCGAGGSPGWVDGSLGAGVLPDLDADVVGESIMSNRGRWKTYLTAIMGPASCEALRWTVEE